MDADERAPVLEVLGDLRIHPLPDGWTAIEAFMIIKTFDETGQVQWCYRTTSRPNREELLGALMVQCDLLRRELVAEYESDE